jgi:signal transduction histidine kinase
MPRCESVCQYTIEGNVPLEIKDLSSDIRFKHYDFVKGESGLQYYLGIPLKTENGFNIGALCVLDRQCRKISDANVELLKILAHEIVARLKAMKSVEVLASKAHSVATSQKRLAHDIRGPITGIIGLASLLDDPDQEEKKNFHEYISLIKSSGNTILDLANEILIPEGCSNEASKDTSLFNLLILKEKLEHLYRPQAINKKIDYSITISEGTCLIAFPKQKLLQIAGNLISNAIKFTPVGGNVSVELKLDVAEPQTKLYIIVKDSGRGLTSGQIESIIINRALTTEGTGGEKGFGLGLVTVKYLVDSLQGELQIDSEIDEGSTFTVVLPQNL